MSKEWEGGGSVCGPGTGERGDTRETCLSPTGRPICRSEPCPGTQGDGGTSESSLLRRSAGPGWDAAASPLLPGLGAGLHLAARKPGRWRPYSEQTRSLGEFCFLFPSVCAWGWLRMSVAEQPPSLLRLTCLSRSVRNRSASGTEFGPLSPTQKKKNPKCTTFFLEHQRAGRHCQVKIGMGNPGNIADLTSGYGGHKSQTSHMKLGPQRAIHH